jgi:oligopeptide/dipeptide ABC transporter ATP-binding protein
VTAAVAGEVRGPNAGEARDAAPLLAVRDLRVSFATAAGRVRALDGVDLDVLPGETLAVVGESGCGKSTLARAIVGLVRAEAGSIRHRGRELVAGGRGAARATERTTQRTTARGIQLVFQDPTASLDPRLPIGAQLAEALRLAGRDAAESAALLADVGLAAEHASRRPHELSGGQCQRACIARALAVRPELLICDEAVSALDVSVRAQILNLLASLQERLGLAIVFIAHDLAVVRHVASRVAVLYLGRVVEEGPAELVLGAPRHPYTQALLASVPRLAGRAAGPTIGGEVPSALAPPPGCAFHPRCPVAFARCSAETPRLLPTPVGRARCFLAEAGRAEAAQAEP